MFILAELILNKVVVVVFSFEVASILNPLSLAFSAEFLQSHQFRFRDLAQYKFANSIDGEKYQPGL